MPKTDHFVVSAIVNAPPERVFTAWTEGPEHGAMTGSPATSEPWPGGSFTAWDGYIQGVHRVLEPGRRIVQDWRAADFPDGSPDSRLEIKLEAVGEGTRITLEHSGIPRGQGEEFQQGWTDYYFEPMKRYFG